MKVVATIARALCVLPPCGTAPPCTTRRAVLAALPIAIAPLYARAEVASPLTASQMLTAGQWLNDIKAARRGLDEVRPLLEMNEDRGYEAVRVTVRKAPVNGIRKACSKILQLLPENSPALKAKTKLYENIKKTLGELDDGARPDVKPRPDLMKLLTQLQADLDEFAAGLGISAAEPEPVPVQPVSERLGEPL